MMDQQAWDRFYDELEDGLPATTRGGPAVDNDMMIGLDRARFAIDRGDTPAAIAELQAMQGELAKIPPGAATRGTGGQTALERLEALEDRLHDEIHLGTARIEIVGEAEELPTRSASRNAKVIRSTKFGDIAGECERLFETARILDQHRSTVRWYSSRIVNNRKVYEEIENETGVPWWFTGLIHGMECSYSLRKHLHNGDSLNARTWQVPSGRPKTGSPPFEFVESACDALAYDGFADEDDWSIARVLYRLEKYNGFGYRSKFGTVSPYLWSFCNHYVSGKYVKDGVYDPDAVSKQCGTAATLRDLMEGGHVSFDAPQPEPQPAPEPAAQPEPAVQPGPVEPQPNAVQGAPAQSPIVVAPEPIAAPSNATAAAALAAAAAVAAASTAASQPPPPAEQDQVIEVPAPVTDAAPQPEAQPEPEVVATLDGQSQDEPQHQGIVHEAAAPVNAAPAEVLPGGDSAQLEDAGLSPAVASALASLVAATKSDDDAAVDPTSDNLETKSGSPSANN